MSDDQYQSDLNKLRSTNKQLQQTNADIKAKETQILAKVSDIRSKLALAEAENARLKKELTSRPIPQAGPSIDEKMTWRKEKAHLEAEVRSMRRDAEERVKLERALLSEQQSKQGIRAENERLKYGWAIMAEQYAELHECLVETQREWSRASRTLAAERERLEGNIAVLETDLIARREEVEDLRDHAKASWVERKALAQIIDNLRADSDIANSPVAVDSTLSHKLDNNFEASDIRHIIELASGHLDLVMSNSADTPFHIASLTETILALEIDLRQRETSLHTLELSHGRLETEHEALKIEHATCGATSSQLRYELDQAEQVIDSRGEEVASVRLELSRAIERGDKQAELLARANDQAFRSKFAEEALEEEVTQ
jgi:chromosome segregation ATPase